ncbi:MAG: dihydroorotate dehydrogenase electron transfer subunit [Bifidobacteriaceae bacterium]|nr:dihydroorotate dehydrogenase electron transfer subunit [Bifidobacteriaceae bacterium]
MFKPTEIVVKQAHDAHLYPSRRSVQVVESRQLTSGVYMLRLRDEFIAKHAKPAQFINVYSHDAQRLLPRPFGVCNIQDDIVTIMYAVIGDGTEEFSHLQAGDFIDILGPLGKPYDLQKSAHYVLIGGGLGIPPVLSAAQYLAVRDDVKTTAVLGYRDEKFADDIAKQYVADVHSISNSEGNVITVLQQLQQQLQHDDLPVICIACGPAPMMKAIAHWAKEFDFACQFSLEERMGCGYGTCVACVVDTVDGRKKVCVDGPVFTSEDLGWR